MTAPRVTVPVEPTEAMRLVPDRVLTETLYWMARAYGRVHSMPRVSDTELANKIEAAKANLGRARDASPILSNSAAPAPEGGAVIPADEMTESALKNRAIALLKLKGWKAGDRIHMHGVIGLMTEFGMDVTNRPEEDRCGHPDCGCDFDQVCDAALATREEAPAEAGERETLRVLLDNLVIAQSLSKELRQRATDEARSYLSALRAQPPAREDAQPAAWRAVWRDGTVYGEPKNWPPPDGASTYHGLMSRTIQPLYTHPAPDALRVAVEAFMPSAEVAFLWAKEAPPADEVQRYRERYWAVKEALAALQAEQKGKP